MRRYRCFAQPVRAIHGLEADIMKLSDCLFLVFGQTLAIRPDKEILAKAKRVAAILLH